MNGAGFARTKRLLRVFAGFTVLVAGVAMLVLPGPGLLAILLGLALLSAEFVWAERLLEKVKSRARSFRGGSKTPKSA